MHSEIIKHLELIERKRERIIRTILGSDVKRLTSVPKKVLNSKMISSKKDLNYEECLELKMTKNQANVFLFIDEYWKMYGYGPTVREVMKHRKSNSLGSTHEIINRLIKLGVLKKMEKMERSVRPVYINFRKLDVPD
jgi:sulfur relay (sulfurtransferase) DsrC/TusE family protein